MIMEARNKMDNLFKLYYDKLPAAQRRHILKAIADEHYGFSLRGIEKFEQFGRFTETGVYDFEDSEFVFVPGDIVRLGWEQFVQGMDAATRNDLMGTLSEYGVTDLDAFLRSVMSPVRTVKIDPMLVERRANEIGWRRAYMGEPEIWNNAEIRRALERFKGLDTQCHIVHERFRLRRIEDGGIELHLYQPVSYDNFKASVTQNGFALPTENEWEYLCGGGSRTLWRWGDSFDFNIKLKHFAAGLPAKCSFDLQCSNQFGLEIAYDPYKQEVIDGEPYFKGGDGGRYICGGGMALGYLPVATYFRDLSMEDDPLGYMHDVGGDYTCYRRIVRL